MRRRNGIMDVLAVLSLLFFSTVAFSAELGTRGKKEYAGSCRSIDAGFIYVLTNASSTSSCNMLQAVGDETAFCACKSDGSGGYEWALLSEAIGAVSEAHLSNYVRLSGSGESQTIYGADSTTSPDGFKVHIAAEEYSVMAGSNTPFFADLTGAFIGSPTGAGSIGVSDGLLTIGHSTGSVTIDAALAATIGSSGEGWTTMQGVRYGAAATEAPYSCSGGSSPVGYYTDTDGPDLCYCNGTAWAPVDGTGACNNPIE